MANIILHFDGAIYPKNPGGTASYGFHVTVDGVEATTGNGVIGTGPQFSNNYAELYAAFKGLQAVLEIICRIRDKDKDAKIQLFIKGDSQIAINCLKRRRGNMSKLYYPAYAAAIKQLSKIRTLDIAVFIDWIPREDNQYADDLSKAQQ